MHLADGLRRLCARLWAWLHGQRAALDRVPPGEIDAVRDECYAILAPEVQDDGSVALRQSITYTVATY